MTPDGHSTSSTEPSLAFSQAVKGMVSIVGLMTMVFTLLEVMLPSSFVQPVSALACGVALTIFLVWWYKWHLATLLTTSLAFGLLLIILHLIVSRPAIVTGRVVADSQQPQPGVSLVLTDSSGVNHNATSDVNGVFTVSHMPAGPFTLTANGELLFVGEVCSGWRRMLTPRQEIGAFAYQAQITIAPTAETTPPAGMTPPTEMTPPDVLSGTPTPTESIPTVQIIDIEYAPATSPLDEVVILRNEGDAPQNMSGWQLEDMQRHIFSFPPFTLPAGGRVKVWTKAGQNTQTDLFWNFGRPVWNDDTDTATLKNEQGEVIDTFTYPP